MRSFTRHAGWWHRWPMVGSKYLKGSRAKKKTNEAKPRQERMCVQCGCVMTWRAMKSEVVYVEEGKGQEEWAQALARWGTIKESRTSSLASTTGIGSTPAPSATPCVRARQCLKPTENSHIKTNAPRNEGQVHRI